LIPPKALVGWTILAVLGPFLCAAQTAQDASIDLGGYRVHISESGSGAPAVIFEAGLGEDLATWTNVQPQVARFARTIAYDRPGLGKSDPSPHPKTVQQMAAELHSLLQVARVTPPYVLVGHSLGGTIVQVLLICIQAKLQGWCSSTQKMEGSMTCCAPT
jgi:alpha-beta hydrolase superfamily lysophospholipase